MSSERATKDIISANKAIDSLIPGPCFMEGASTGMLDMPYIQWVDEKFQWYSSVADSNQYQNDFSMIQGEHKLKTKAVQHSVVCGVLDGRETIYGNRRLIQIARQHHGNPSVAGHWLPVDGEMEFLISVAPHLSSIVET